MLKQGSIEKGNAGTPGQSLVDEKLQDQVLHLPDLHLQPGRMQQASRHGHGKTWKKSHTPKESVIKAPGIAWIKPYQPYHTNISFW